MAPERQASLAKLFVDFGLNDTALSLISDLAKNKDLSKSFFGALEAVGNDQAHAGRVLALFQTLLENANKGTISPEKIKEIANTKPQQILGKNEFGQLEALLYKQAQGPKGGKTEAIDKLLHVAAERTRREPFVQVHLDDLKAPPRTFVKVMSMVRDNVMGPEIFEMASRCQDKKELLHNIARYEAVDHAYNSKKLDLNLVKTLAHMPLSEKAEKELFKLLSHPDPAQLAAFVKKEESKVVNIF